jgi:hypothetical protein
MIGFRGRYHVYRNHIGYGPVRSAFLAIPAWICVVLGVVLGLATAWLAKVS